MTHDPMCPSPCVCLCGFIAKVRADERINAVQECMESGCGMSAIFACRTSDAMTHDPLCPTEQCVICEWAKDAVEWCQTCGGCQCDLIAKVRADTAHRIKNAVNTHYGKYAMEYGAYPPLFILENMMDTYAEDLARKP